MPELNMNLITLASQQWLPLAAASVALLMLVLLAMELRSSARLRGVLTRELARIAEQLDLVRLESLRVPAVPVPAQLAAEPTRTSLPVLGGLPATADAGRYAQAERLARSGARACDLVERCGLTLAEARVVIAMHARGGQ